MMFNFDTGDAAGVDAASRVHIVGRDCMKPWSVGVSGDQGHLVFQGKVGESFFHPILADIIFGGAGRIQHAEMLQRAPEVPDKKTGKLPEGGV